MMYQILKNEKCIHQPFAIEKGNTGLDFISKMKQSFLQHLIHAIKFIIVSHNAPVSQTNQL